MMWSGRTGIEFLTDWHMLLSEEERRRYSRNIQLVGIGTEGQMRLLAAHVVIIGCGALGSITSMYLAGSGVGKLTIADFDTIDVSNLQRQLSFTTDACGKSKADETARRLKEINPEITIVSHNKLLSKNNIGDVIGTPDLIIEGSDNPATKYLVTDYAVSSNIPYVMGGVDQWHGQVMTWRPGCRSYRDIFPDSIDTPEGITPCASGGVHGPLPGIIGATMASEAIKIICRCGKPLYNRMMLIDTLSMESQVINV